MTESTQAELIPAVEVARQTRLSEAPNGVRFACFAETAIDSGELERLVQAVPTGLAAALRTVVYYFVPLAMAEPRPAAGSGTPGLRARAEETMISPSFSPELAELAICHRNVELDQDPGEGAGAREGVFISTRLLPDRFSLAFEFFINVGHALVEAAGVPAAFGELVWRQVVADVRGETSQDAWENRAAALHPAAAGTTHDGPGPIDERARTAYTEAAFSDAVAIYLLSLALDFDYAELREREYPLLAPQALADRLRHINVLFPPNANYEFAIRYRRRG